MINYLFFSTIVSKDPGVIQDGTEFGKISSSEFDTLTYHVYDFDTFGQGYAVVSADRIFYDYNLSYFDYDHNLVWSKYLNTAANDINHVIGSEQYVIVMTAENNMVYNIDGELLSDFSINYTNPYVNYNTY